MESNIAFADLLRSLRAQRGWSVRSAAHAAKIPLCLWSGWEGEGPRSLPKDPSLLRRIADTFSLNAPSRLRFYGAARDISRDP